MKTPDGKPLYDEIMRHPGNVVLPENVVEGLFGTSMAVGKKIKTDPESNPMEVAAVMQPMREGEFDKAIGHYLTCLKTDQEVSDLIT